MFNTNGKLIDNWKETLNKEIVELNDNINLNYKDIDDYYVLIEMYDAYNIPHYSNLYGVNNNEVS